MALLIKKPITVKGLSGEETLTDYYARIEPKLIKTGDSLTIELYYYANKAGSQADVRIKAGDLFPIEYQVTNDGYILYGLHLLAKAELLKDNPEWVDADVEIVDIDIPPA